MKKLVVMMAAVAFAAGVNAQSPEGIKMYKYERYQSAMNTLQGEAGSNAMANYYVGLSQIGLGDLNAAKATFSKHPEDPANMAGMARVAFEQGNVAEGTQRATAVANMAKKKNWEPLRFAADAITYTEGGNYQQAIDWYKKALETAPDNADLLIGMGDAYRHLQGGGGPAMSAYEKVTAKDPNNSLAFSRIGSLWYAAKNYELALENYNKAKTTDTQNPLPYFDLANAYYWTGKYDLAKQNIEKYRELSDRNPEVERQYLGILYKSKDYQNAIQKANELLKSNNNLPKIHGLLGEAYLATGDSIRALQEYTIYMHSDDKPKPSAADVKFGEMFLKVAMGDSTKANYVDSANHYFDLGIASDTAQNKAETYRKIAEAFKDAKQYGKSADWFTKLVTTYPESPAIDYFWSAVMYYYSKDYAKAATQGAAYEAKYADQPSATYWRGRIAAATDEEAKTGAAVEHYNKWLTTVGPNHDRKADLMQAYQYLALYYYNKSDKTNMDKYLDEIEKIEPANAFLKQLRELEKQMKS